MIVSRVLHNARRDACPANAAVVEIRLHVAADFYGSAGVCFHEGIAVEYGKHFQPLRFIGYVGEGLLYRDIDRHVCLD